MQFPVKYQHTTLKITGFDHAHVDQIEGEASKNHAETTQTALSHAAQSQQKESLFSFSCSRKHGVFPLSLFSCEFSSEGHHFLGGKRKFQSYRSQRFRSIWRRGLYEIVMLGGWEETGSQMTQAWHEPSYLGYPDPTSSLLKSKLAHSSSKIIPVFILLPSRPHSGINCKYLLRSLYHQPTQNINMGKSIKPKGRHIIQDPVFALRSRHFA